MKKSRNSKMIKPLVFLSAVSFTLTGMIPFAVSNVQAGESSEINYGEGEKFEGSDLTPVIAEGDVKALVIRLGYEDYPIDTSNDNYVSDDSFQILFNGYEEGELREFYKSNLTVLRLFI